MSDQRLIAALERGGLANAADVVAAFNYIKADPRVGFSLAACCSMLENESNGQNLFGSDPGGYALPQSWYGTQVTQTKYTVYKVRRNLGMTPNGVGPCQLTNATLQKAAEKAGGCWKPLYNMRVGFEFLKQLFQAHGSALGGFTAYNGSGPAAEAYGQRAVARMAVWQSRINAA